MKKEIVEKVENQTPEELAAREKEITEFVKKDYQEHRAMMDKLAEGFENKEPQIYIMNYKTVQKYLRSVNYYGFFDANTYIISFYGEGEKKVNFDRVKARVCQQRLDDVRFVDNIEQYYNEHKNEFMIIAKFISEAVANGAKIVCQCNAGVSRSAATAKAIKDFFYGTGYEIDESGEYIPNDLFYRCIVESLSKLT